MAMREIEAISDAIDATNKEIAGAAWDQDDIVHDETGDRTVEQMGEGLEGQHEPDDDDETPEVEETEGEESEAGEETGDGKGQEAKGATEEEPEKPGAEADKPAAAKTEGEGRVPPGRLREQTERAKAAEAERDKLKADLAAAQSSSKQEIAALNARLDQVLATVRQSQSPAKAVDAPKPDAVPDIFENPTGFADHLIKGFKDELAVRDQRIDGMRVETSMAIAHGKHGDTFAKAFEAIGTLNPRNPDDQMTVRRIYGSSNPGEALVAWHKRSETLRQVGDDPAAYAEKIRTETREALMKDPEFRKQLVAGLREEATGADNGKPNTITRLPKSLNGAAGGNRRESEPTQVDDNDQAIAAAAWR